MNKVLAILLLVVMSLCFMGCGFSGGGDETTNQEDMNNAEIQDGYDEDTVEYDPSDFWQYDVTGKYFDPKANSDGIIQAGPDQLDAQISFRNGTDSHIEIDTDHYIEITSDSTGYFYSDEAVNIDLDRETKRMRLVRKNGEVYAECRWEYSEELQEWYFIMDFGGESYFFKYDDSELPSGD